MVQGRGNAVVAWNVAGRLMLLAVVAVALVQYAQGATTHDVGGADEWVAPPGTTNTVNSSYLSDWASTQTFAVGDSLFFEYTVGSHDVLEVTNASYTDCNTTNPIHMWTAGNTTVLLNSTGTLYFICGFPGHCLAGQKVAITVISGSPSPPSSTTPPPTPNGSTISSLPASAAAVVFGALFVACGSLFW